MDLYDLTAEAPFRAKIRYEAAFVLRVEFLPPTSLYCRNIFLTYLQNKWCTMFGSVATERCKNA